MADNEEEYKKQLGLVGLQMMKLAGEPTPARPAARNQSLAYRDVDAVFDSHITEIDDTAFDSLVDRLRSSVLKVRLVGAFNDVVSPLYERLRIIQAENEQAEFMRHHEDALYYDKMLDALFNLESKNSSQNRGIYLATKEFMRHPMWNSLRLSLRALVETTRFTFGLAFGFRKRKSDTDRIVDAIKEQTQWHMTKSISQQQGFFTRLLRQGILGMPIRGLATSILDQFGLGRRAAQENEDLRSRGGEVGGFKAFFSDFFYGDSITRRGRLGSMEEEDDCACFDPLIELVSSQLKEQQSIHEIIRAAANANSNAGRITDQRFMIERQEQKMFEGELIEMLRDNRTGVFKVADNTKDTFKEVRKHRLQAFWTSLLNIGTSIISGIASAGLRLGSLITNLLPLKAIGTLLRGLGSSIVSGVGKAIMSLGGLLLGKAGLGSVFGNKNGKGVSTPSVGGRGIPGVVKGVGAGAVLSLGAGFAADKLGRDTKAGAGVDVLGTTAGYASTGALLGSVVPGVGTLAGGLVGGAVGLGKGVWDNRDTLFGSTPKDPVEAATENAISLSSELTAQLMADLNDKTESSINAMKENTKKTDEMVQLLRGIRENTKTQAGEIISPLETTTSQMLKNLGGR